MKPCREPANFARSGITMQRAFGGGLAESLGRQPERFLGRGSVAGSQSVGYPLHRGVHVRLYQTVAGLALFALAMALDRGRMRRNMRHNRKELTAPPARVNMGHAKHRRI